MTAVERVPALAFLLHVAALECPEIALQVVIDDAASWLAALPNDEAPDIVYLDPMFSEHGRAQVKKDMQACRALAVDPLDEAGLLAVARSKAKDRVVVKRHPNLAPIADDVSHAVTGERVRFDVYLA